MPSLTIGGQVYEIRLTPTNLQEAEDQILKAGGTRLLALWIRGTEDRGMFSLSEVYWLLWGAWRGQSSNGQVRTRLDQFYAEGGTLFELNGVLQDALVESGVFGRRKTDEAPPADPPGARASG